MLRRIAALIMALVFVGHLSASGAACGIDALVDSLNSTSYSPCSMQNQADCEEQSCCAQGESSIGSVAAMACCEIVCGESPSDTSFNLSPQPQAPVLPYNVTDIVSVDMLGISD